MPQEAINFVMKDLFRKIAFIEGLSYLLLLFVAMPLKYIWMIPEPVKYTGWAHGMLFMAYVVLLFACAFTYKWTLIRTAGYFLASLLPFLPFVVEKKLRSE